MTSHSLSSDFINYFKIESFHKPPERGGQKLVYFPVINNEKQVLKLFSRGNDERFQREMRIYEKFKENTGIPKIISQEVYGSDIVIFEEFIEGDTLKDIVATYRHNSQKVCSLIRDLFEILTPIWNEQFVHRDIKPENIIIRPNGKPVLLDFGIARDLSDESITGTGIQPMSWTFASPEQYKGDKRLISNKTDFFSLGVLAYYLYHQSLPFGNTFADVKGKFTINDQSFAVDEGFTLKSFCESSMKFSPSERPRKIQDLLSLI